MPPSVDRRRIRTLKRTRLVALGLLALALAACGATASNAPGAGGDSATAPLPSVATAGPTAGASAAGSGTANASGSGGGLADTPTAKMCTLLTADEAKALLGKDLSEPPNGAYLNGLGTNCIYQDDPTMAPGTFIKVEINPVSYQTNVGLLTLGGGAGSTVAIAGLEATGVDVGGIHTDAGLVVKLSDGGAAAVDAHPGTHARHGQGGGREGDPEARRPEVAA